MSDEPDTQLTFRCTYCERALPHHPAPADLGLAAHEELRAGSVYPFDGCSCGYGKFVRLAASSGDHPTRRSDDLSRGTNAAGTNATAMKLNHAEYKRLPVKAICPNPNQPRRFFDAEALEGLAESIRKVGLLEDILVRPVADHYEIILGERRWRASQVAELDTIAAKVVDLNDSEMQEIAIVENIHRQDLTPVEEAFAFKAYVDSGDEIGQVGAKFGGMHERVAARLKLLNSHSYITYQEERIAELNKTVEHLRSAVSKRAPTQYAVELATEENLVSLLEAGYDLVATLPDSRHVLRRRCDDAVDSSPALRDRP